MDKQQILIVDDEPLVISELVGFLRDESYEIFTAKNGIEGLDILRKEEIGLAVVEMDMEGMDGLTLLKQVKEEKIQTVMLIMKGWGTMELGEEVVKAGAVSVFDKPIKRDVFLAKIKKFIPPQDIWKGWLESFLEANYNNADLKFEDVMCYFRFSKSYGYALFKKHLGKTFREALKEVRIEKAKSLIKETPLSISEISEHCGFRSPQRFSEAFRRLHGTSPRGYRKKVDIDVKNQT